MKTSDFHQRILTNEDTAIYVSRNSKTKEMTVSNTGIKSEYLAKDHVETTRKLCKKAEDPSDSMEIKEIDFFKTTFWGEPIPSRKIERVITAS